MHRLLVRLCLFSALATGVAAHADTFYSYSFTGSGVSGSGDTSLTGTATDGVYQVTLIDGQVNGTNITGLLPVNTFNNNDNLFYDSDTYLDANGVSFQLDGGANVNISYSNGDWFFEGDSNFVLDGGNPPLTPDFLSADVSGNTTIQLDSFTFAPEIVPTPEPSAIVLLGTGLFGIGFLQIRSMRSRREPLKAS